MRNVNIQCLKILALALKGIVWNGKTLQHLSLILLLLLAPVSTTSQLCAAGEENKRWSFDFTNTSISDVLEKLTRTTGIDILSNQPPSNTTVNKHYVDQTIDEIVKDLFKGLSFGLVWHHGEKGIDALDIWVFDGGGGQSSSFSRIERPMSRTPALRYGRKAPAPVEKENDIEDAEKPEEDVDESISQPSEPDEESEKEDADSDNDSETGSAVNEENLPEDESDERTETESPPIPTEAPGFD